jgi:hypothetical protein
MLTLLWTLSSGGVALAQDETAELVRLEDEMERLSTRNAWGGVDQAYQDALDLGLPLEDDLHWLGAQAALAQGQMLKAWYRMERLTPPADPAAEPGGAWARARGEKVQLEDRYGLVAISVSESRVAVLTRPEMPFAQRERDAISRAREVIRTDRAFRGLLPAGQYQLDDLTFEVVAGRQWQVIAAD